MSYQKIIIVGNLGRDPEMRYTPTAQTVTSFSVATSRSWVGADGQKVEKTTWHRVSVWGKQAEACNNILHKGDRVLVEGRVEAHAWVNQEGKPQANLDVTAENVRFLTKKGEVNESSSSEEVADVASSEEDSIPF